MKPLNDIPIPRKGIFWGVLKQMPPHLEGDVYYLWPSVVDTEMNATDELAQFESELQAVVSVWLMGFSYQQMLKIFDEYKTVGEIRKRVFPESGNVQSTKIELWEHPPRQLVDVEYLAIVKEIGIPNGKIHKEVYERYMKWFL